MSIWNPLSDPIDPACPEPLADIIRRARGVLVALGAVEDEVVAMYRNAPTWWEMVSQVRAAASAPPPFEPPAPPPLSVPERIGSAVMAIYLACLAAEQGRAEDADAMESLRQAEG